MSKQHLTVDAETVEKLLSDAGHRPSKISGDTWRSTLAAAGAKLPFLVRIEPSGYLTFAVVPFAKSPKDPKVCARLYARLLELNQSLMMAKFSIDDDLDIVLSVEYPTAEFDASEFQDAVDVLAYYAEKHLGELTAFH